MYCIGIVKYEGWLGVLNSPAVCKRRRILMRLKPMRGERRGGERWGARSRWQKTGGGNGGGEREINGVVGKVNHMHCGPSVLSKGIVE